MKESRVNNFIFKNEGTFTDIKTDDKKFTLVNA